MSEDEKSEMEVNKSDMKLSSMIIKNMEVDKRTDLLKQQRKKENEQLEETDSSSDDDSEVMNSDVVSRESAGLMAPMKLSADPVVAEIEKKMLRGEFFAAMQSSFLEGRDKDFDYSMVDEDEAYDSLEMKQKDAEDDYFDTEEPSWCEVDAQSDSNDRMEIGSGLR